VHIRSHEAGESDMGRGSHWVIDLCEAILLRAMRDLIETADYSLRRSRVVGPEVRRWFSLGEDDPHPLSFHSCCDAVGLAPSYVLKRLKPWMTPANAQHSDFTNLLGYMTERDKVAYLHSKLSFIGRASIRTIWQSASVLLTRRETVSILNAMLARGQVQAVRIWVGRNRVIFYEQLQSSRAVHRRRKPALHEKLPARRPQPQDRKDPGDQKPSGSGVQGGVPDAGSAMRQAWAFGSGQSRGGGLVPVEAVRPGH